MKKVDAAIIGGGLAGLIAANDLAEAGKRVVLLEKAGRVGGRAVTNERNGARFNLGGHALYKEGELNAILNEYGIRPEGGSPPASGFAIWRNQAVPLPGDPFKLILSKLMSWSGKMELGRLMLALGKIDAGSLPACSLREWAEKEVRDPMVRHLFYALCRTGTYTYDPDHQLAGPALKQMQRSLKGGVHYANGGWQTIADGLRERAVRLGADVLCGSGVAEIRHDGGAVRGLTLANGETLEAGHVLTAMSPAEAYRLVRGVEHTALRRWKEEARPALAACLDLSLKRLPSPNCHFAIGIDQPVFFTNHSRVAKLSDDGTMVVHLIKYNGTGEQDPKADERLLEQTMHLLHPGWQREVVARQYLPNMTVVHDYPHIGRNGSLPGPAVPEIRGLYVAGDWASHGELLADAAAASGRRAAASIVKELDAARSLSVQGAALV
ncbi:phytoene desaturase family protein [Paenibacillus sp. MBLB4367]|uniref:phytoene desaturase family protein n=1 Tax=Paenibacillus sp. MBLB4367 TaxID=3384767 RepID=UPI0039082261